MRASALHLLHVTSVRAGHDAAEAQELSGLVQFIRSQG
jgi:hypothetical protein